MKKTMAFVLAVMMLVCMFAFTGCQQEEEAKFDKAYTMSTYQYISNGEYQVWNYDLKLFTDGSYILTEKINYFDNYNPVETPSGDLVITTGFATSAMMTTTSFGTFTSAPSADGDPTHVDLTLNKAERVTYEQHGWLTKWVAPAALGAFTGILDSDNWVESNNQYYADGADAFMAEYAHGYTVTVTDPTGAGVDNGAYEMLTVPVKN